jgi:hypothetical protein
VARRAGLPLSRRPSRRPDRGPRRRSRVKLPVGRVSDGTRDFPSPGLKTAMLREFERRNIDGTPLDADNLPLISSISSPRFSVPS